MEDKGHCTIAPLMARAVNKWRSILPAFLLALAALGQSAPGDSSTKAALVTVSFFVSDGRNQPIADVKQGDLTILDNKQPVASIASLKRGSELPLRLGLLIDASNSERASSLYQPGIRAASALLNQILSGPDDRVLVVKVSHEPETTALMNRDELLKYKVDLTPSGGTALYDAIATASDQVTKLDTPQLARRVLILLSDGDDNASRIDRNESLAAALKAGVVIFAVSTGDESASIRLSSSEKGNSALKAFAEKTGGQAFLHLRSKDIDKVFGEIQQQIAGMYSVAFAPADGTRRGFHAIELKSGLDRVRLRVPAGYYLK